MIKNKYITEIQTTSAMEGEFENFEEAANFYKQQLLKNGIASVAKIKSVSKIEVESGTGFRAQTDYRKVEGFCDCCDRVCFEDNSQIVCYDDAEILLCDRCIEEQEKDNSKS